MVLGADLGEFQVQAGLATGEGVGQQVHPVLQRPQLVAVGRAYPHGEIAAFDALDGGRDPANGARQSPAGPVGEAGGSREGQQDQPQIPGQPAVPAGLGDGHGQLHGHFAQRPQQDRRREPHPVLFGGDQGELRQDFRRRRGRIGGRLPVQHAPGRVGHADAAHRGAQEGGRRLDGGVDDGRQLFQRSGGQTIFQGAGQLGRQHLTVLV